MRAAQSVTGVFGLKTTTLTKVLREEWGFEGISGWMEWTGVLHDRVAAEERLELEMPPSFEEDDEVAIAVRDGRQTKKQS